MKNIKRNKRNLILEKAFELFFEKGYLDTKIIDIAEAAGIGKGTVYEYFNSKEELFAELLSSKVVDHYSKFGIRLETSGYSYQEQLKQYILFERETARRYGNGKNYIDRLTAESGMFQNTRLKEVIDKLLSYRFETVLSIIKKGIEAGEFLPLDPVMTTVSLMGSISFYLSFAYGLLSVNSNISYTASRDNLPAQEDEFFRLIFNGLLKPGEDT